MKSPYCRLFTLLACTAVAGAQDLRVHGIPDPGEIGTWGTATNQAYAAFDHLELPGEKTMLFVHTTIDDSVAGPRLARGVIGVYPFMIHPHPTWNGYAPELAALSASVEIVNPSAAVVIPPRRLAAHLQKFVTDPAAMFGTHNQGTLPRTTNVGPLTWPTQAQADERWPWAEVNPDWVVHTTLHHVLSVPRLGRMSVTQAAHEYRLLNPNLPPLDAEAIDRLNGFLENDLGFEIHLQAAHILPAASPSERHRVRLSPTVVMRRRSLHEDPDDLWLKLLGPPRSVSSLLDHNVDVYLAGRGDQMHIVFPHPVTQMRAWVATTGGLAELQQLPNPLDEEGNPLRPWTAIFTCPDNAIGCIAYFDSLLNPGVAITPVNAMGAGALLWPFDMWAAHLVQ